MNLFRKLVELFNIPLINEEIEETNHCAQCKKTIPTNEFFRNWGLCENCWNAACEKEK